ncbi:MAG: zf-HC2 domain-containing protein [Vicinamibacterales bacterium]
MTVSRDVVFDLLPGYFAGDVSADSRALVDEHLAGDPEFAAMAERFGRLLRQAPGPTASEPARAEAETVTRARRAQQRRGEFRGLALGYGMATLLLAAAALAGYRPGRAFIIAATFGIVAAASGVGWYLAGRRPEWFGDPRWF